VLIIRALYSQTWYFGLHYVNALNQETWLLNDKKLSKQRLKRENPLKFQFKFRFFPENVAEEVIQEVTIRLLFKQVEFERTRNNDVVRRNVSSCHR